MARDLPGRGLRLIETTSSSSGLGVVGRRLSVSFSDLLVGRVRGLVLVGLEGGETKLSSVRLKTEQYCSKDWN